jgi:hypothetical protein
MAKAFKRPDDPCTIKAVLEHVATMSREELEAHINWLPEGYDDENSLDTSEFDPRIGRGSVNGHVTTIPAE